MKQKTYWSLTIWEWLSLLIYVPAALVIVLFSNLKELIFKEK